MEFTDEGTRIRTNSELGPTEASPDTIQVYGKVSGPMKVNRDAMVSFSTIDDTRFSSGYGFFDMFLTWDQVEELHRALGALMARPR